MHCPKHGTPYRSYALLIASFTGVSSLVAAAGRRDLSLSDLLLLGVGTHKITNLIATDRVTSTLRAPFTKQEDHGDHIEECPEDEGMRRALGELVTCPYCLGPWVSGGLLMAHTLRPTWTRRLLGLFAGVAISDFLHHANERISSGE